MGRVGSRNPANGVTSLRCFSTFPPSDFLLQQKARRAGPPDPLPQRPAQGCSEPLLLCFWLTQKTQDGNWKPQKLKEVDVPVKR